MRRSPTIVILVSMVFVASLAGALPAAAADSPIGTYVKKEKGGAMTLKIEQWGPGKAKLVWSFKGGGMDGMSMSLVSSLDGKDAPLLANGKPSGETMAIKLIDKLHSSTIVKMNGQPFGTSKATFSADFKTMTVENDFTSTVGGMTAGKSTEVWVRQ